MNEAGNFAGREEQSGHYTVASRRWVAKGSDVFVKEFTLEPGQDVPWHSHTAVFDIFYCLEGRLTIERLDLASGRRLGDLALQVGDRAKVDTGTAHRPFNPGTGQCRFLIIQGVGDYDFIPFKGT